MSDISREEFAKAVAETVGSVEHLYKEVDRFFSGLRADLSESPNPLGLVRGSSFGKSRLRDGRKIHYEYPVLFGPINLDEDDEDNEDLDDEDDGVSGSSRKKLPDPEVVSEQPLLAVRVTIYDPESPKSSEPTFHYAVCSDWSLANDPQPETGLRFLLKAHMFSRIPKALDSKVEKGQRVRTQARVNKVIGGKKGLLGAKKGTERNLSCRLPLGAKRIPLFVLNDPEQLEKLVQDIKDMWSRSAIEN